MSRQPYLRNIFRILLIALFSWQSLACVAGQKEEVNKMLDYGELLYTKGDFPNGKVGAD